MKGKGNVQYIYDATGVRLQKLTVDSISRHTTTTLYLGGFVYQQKDTITNPGGGADTLQFLIHEEGRARWAFHRLLNGTTKYGWEYDFYEKDHLGNPRILLTQEKDTAQYLASMEAAYRNSESKLFYNLINTGYARNLISGYPVDTTVTNPNDSVSRVNGNGNKVGPGIILKVMSGDKVDIAVQSYYNNITDTAGPRPSVNDVLASLAPGIVSMTGGAHGGLTDLNNTTTSPVYAAINSFQGANNPNQSGKPKAYLNWILLDDQFKYVSSYPQSGAIPVGTANQINNLGYTGIPITKSGYLYVYVSNETPGWDAFFDNLSVRQYSGPLLEESHYYPYGLTMAGISDKAIRSNYAENKYKFNAGNELQNSEFSDGSGLELYDAQHRMLDPQLGRFGQIDPIADFGHSASPYTYAFDNPIASVDPNGLFPGGPHQPIPGPNDNWAWTSDLARQEHQSVDDIHQRIEQEFQEDNDEAGVYYAIGQLQNMANAIWNSGANGTFVGWPGGITPASVKYNYATTDKDGREFSYETPNYYGFTTHQDGDDYMYAGISIKLTHGDSENGESKGEGESWDNTANLVNGGFSFGWGAKENLLDLAAKADKSIEDLRYFKTVKLVSRVAFAAQVGVSGYQTWRAWANSDGNWRTNDGNKWGVTSKAAIDVLMAAAGTFGGPLGWVVAGTYFLLDATTDMNKWSEE
jgi:RHS repeat-associated protein